MTTWAFQDRLLQHYPNTGARRGYLALVVLITVALYYALYVGGGVTPLYMRELHMSFLYLVTSLAVGNLVGAFASLLAGLSDRFGRARLVVWGLLGVGLLTAFAVPAVHNKLAFAVLGIAVGFVEGIILVATPALTRDFSPQVGRATAMGMWAMGPVLGSLMTSAVVGTTLETLGTWRAQFQLCGGFCLAVFVLAFLFLRELKPTLRDQIMVSERDRVLKERLGRGLDTEAALARPWAQVVRPDIVLSALGVSVLLLVYYTTVAFGGDLSGRGVPLHAGAGQPAAGLELGDQCGGADRGGHLERPSGRAQAVHAGGRARRGGDDLGVHGSWHAECHVPGHGAGRLGHFDHDGLCLRGVDGELHRNGRGA